MKVVTINGIRIELGQPAKIGSQRVKKIIDHAVGRIARSARLSGLEYEVRIFGLEEDEP